jgi:Winged helix DNA-binding domain
VRADTNRFVFFATFGENYFLRKLGAHLFTLEEKGYIAVEKTFAARRLKTFVSATASGQHTFNAHAAALRVIFKSKEG